MCGKVLSIVSIIFLLYCISFPSQLRAQHDKAKLQMDSLVQVYDLAGISVLGVCKGEIAFQYFGGFSDLTRQIPTSESTLYRIASISKHISTLLAMKMVTQGTLELDKDINEYLSFEVRNPQFPDEPITVRRLMYHHSSIIDGPTYNGFLNATYAADLPPSIAEYLQEGGAYFHPNTYNNIRPGTWFNYSNANFGLLATVMEAASGMRFDSLANELLFKPLEWNAAFHPGYIDNISDLAVLYRKPAGVWTPQTDNFQGVRPNVPALDGYIPGTNGLYFSPQGGARMSAKDLFKAMQLHFDGGQVDGKPFIDPALMEEMITTQWLYNGNNGNNYFGLFRAWGLGTHISTDMEGADRVFPGKNMMGHPGEAFGLVSDYYFDLASQSGVILIINGSGTGYSFGSSSFYAIEEAVFDIVFKEIITPCSVSTSLEETYLGSEISIFPNPAQDFIFLKSPNIFPVEFSIYDLLGRRLLSGHLGSAQDAIPINDLQPGLYNLSFKVGVHLSSLLFVKQ